jgi:hypothetical protein
MEKLRMCKKFEAKHGCITIFELQHGNAKYKNRL